MLNLAMVFGVSSYQNYPHLSACKNDAKHMNDVLKATEKYRVLNLDENLSKQALLDEIEEFLSVGDTEEIGEILFYFSGHGYEDGNKEYTRYFLRNSISDEINSTTLKSDEIDGLVRKANPNLYVKIIDACHSGMNYIKSADDINNNDDIQKELEKDINKCIFMYSSKREQTSMASADISFFTDEFIRAVFSFCNNESIRYTDIQNRIVDAFEKKRPGKQIPYFVTQTDSRDIFSVSTDSLKALAPKYMNGQDEEVQENSVINSIIDKYVDAFASENTVKYIVASIQESLDKDFPYGENWDLMKYYEIKKQATPREDHREDRAILDFLYDNRNEENFYVKFDVEKEEKENIFRLTMFPFFRNKATRFSLLTEGLPSFLSYELEPLKEGLPVYEFLIVLVYSDLKLHVFCRTKQFLNKAWNHYVRNQSTKNFHRAFDWKGFDIDSWNFFLEDNIEKSREFIEKTLIEFCSK